jgi:FkbM family methyltransferase
MKAATDHRRRAGHRKALLRRLLKRAGFTISRAPDLSDFLRSRNVDLILDVGANWGQFAIDLRRIGYSGRIISFEPIKSVFTELSSVMSKDPRWTGHNYAVGSQPGKGQINVSENTVFSSMLPLAKYAEQFDPKTTVTRTEEIDIVTLDDFIAEIEGSRPFLKIDTQGFERNVLMGASKSIHLFCGLQLELPIEQLYEGGWNLIDALSFLDGIGFVPAQMRPVSLMTDDPQSWIEIDCIFRRK